MSNDEEHQGEVKCCLCGKSMGIRDVRGEHSHMVCVEKRMMELGRLK